MLNDTNEMRNQPMVASNIGAHQFKKTHFKNILRKKKVQRIDNKNIFSLRQGGVVMSSQITHTQSYNKHRLAHILGTFALTSAVAPFLQITPTASCNGNHPSPGDKQTKRGREVRNYSGTKQNWPRETQSPTHAPGLSTPSYLSANCRAASSVIHLLPKATFTSSYPVPTQH